MLPSDHVQAFRDLLGGAGVVDDQQRLTTYTTDQRQLFTGSTLAVLKPATTKQVADVVRLAVRLGIGLVPQGGNTSYCGGATPNASGGQAIVSLERMDTIREVDPLSMSISVDAGAILKNVQDAAASAVCCCRSALARKEAAGLAATSAPTQVDCRWSDMG